MASSSAAKTRAYAQLHVCVLLWGFTAILGKLITLPTYRLVCWRMLIVTACLLCVPRVWRALRSTPPRLLVTYAGIGLLVTLHWLTFYESIKLANASVAVTCLALCPAFLSVIDPWIGERPFDWRELLLGLAVLPGVALVTGGIPAGMQLGLAIGAFSALVVAFFMALNKRYVARADPLLVTTVELGTGAFVLVLFAPLTAAGWAGVMAPPGGRDLVLLLILAFGCTLLPFTLSLVALRHLSAFSSQITVNLEPLYSIVLAILLLGEQRQLSLSFYAGVAIVLSAVFIHPLLRRPRRVMGPDAPLVDAIDRERSP